jgi:hypothetical protein
MHSVFGFPSYQSVAPGSMLFADQRTSPVGSSGTGLCIVSETFCESLYEVVFDFFGSIPGDISSLLYDRARTSKEWRSPRVQPEQRRHTRRPAPEGSRRSRQIPNIQKLLRFPGTQIFPPPVIRLGHGGFYSCRRTGQQFSGLPACWQRIRLLDSAVSSTKFVSSPFRYESGAAETPFCFFAGDAAQDAIGFSSL